MSGAPSADGERDEVVRRARSLIGRGECLVAYDEVHDAIERWPGDVELRAVAVLALVRAGATQRAQTEFDAAGLDEIEAATDLAPAIAEDVAVLSARLAKSTALARAGPERRQLAAEAASRYEAIYRRFRRSYSCINAATLWLVAGEEARAHALARDAELLVAEGGRAESELDAYWSAVTTAEARLVRGDRDGAASVLTAEAVADGDPASRATTLRQLELVCEHTGCPSAVLDPLRNPRVIHYCGHMLLDAAASTGLPSEVEKTIRRAVSAELARAPISAAYGSLASGADLIVAEEVLDAGAELHVVLPFATEEFVAVSVRHAGTHWIPRFERCMRDATSVVWSTDGAYLDAPELFSYASCLAMGNAVMRARVLATVAEQLAVWDGDTTRMDRPTGTARDVAVWSATGRPTRVVPCPDAVEAAPIAPARDERRVHPVLFADVQGYSLLSDAEIRAFVATVFEAFARVLDQFRDSVLFRNTWGDGLVVVLDGVERAARCALALQDEVAKIDAASAGLPGALGLRIGAHAGPMYAVVDPVTDRPAFFGAALTRAARLEPRTPPGDVYVTDAFAALLSIEPDHELVCEYVGNLPAAKDYGRIPMYLLRDRG